jgi:lysophospholipase L1-like esterase
VLPARHTPVLLGLIGFCDHIHPNQAGYQAMANSIDLSLFN